MKKLNIILMILLFLNFGIAQTNNINIKLIKIVKSTPKNAELSTQTLSDYFKNKTKNQSELFKLYYSWIILNISYDYDYLNAESNYQVEYDLSSKSTLENRKTVCSGYAILLNDLCKLSNIKSEIIHGYAINSWNKLEDERINGTINETNHDWNVLFLGNKWELVDVTWDACLMNNCQHNFFFLLDGRLLYFFMSPEKFILSHYPQLEKWQMISKTITRDYFFSKEFEKKRDDENLSSSKALSKEYREKLSKIKSRLNSNSK